MKAVKDTEAIRINVLADSNIKSKVMWRVDPPKALLDRFYATYPNGYWCSTEQELIAIIKKLTGWKLALRKKA